MKFGNDEKESIIGTGNETQLRWTVFKIEMSTWEKKEHSFDGTDFCTARWNVHSTKFIAIEMN